MTSLQRWTALNQRLLLEKVELWNIRLHSYKVTTSRELNDATSVQKDGSQMTRRRSENGTWGQTIAYFFDSGSVQETLWCPNWSLKWYSTKKISFFVHCFMANLSDPLSLSFVRLIHNFYRHFFLFFMLLPTTWKCPCVVPPTLVTNSLIYLF